MGRDFVAFEEGVGTERGGVGGLAAWGGRAAVVSTTRGVVVDGLGAEEPDCDCAGPAEPGLGGDGAAGRRFGGGVSEASGFSNVTCERGT